MGARGGHRAELPSPANGVIFGWVPARDQMRICRKMLGLCSPAGSMAGLGYLESRAAEAFLTVDMSIHS